MSTEGYLLVRVSRPGAPHGSDAADETNAEDKPGICGHEAVAPSVHVQRARRDTDDTNAETSVHESIVQISSLEFWHAAILTGFAVEDEVDTNESCAEDTRTINESLPQIALGHGVAIGSLLV